jgi:hypothetical protein
MDQIPGSMGRGGNGQRTQLGVNLVHTRFLFVTLLKDDEVGRRKVRSAGAAIGRGFVNDFDVTRTRESQTLETIQLLESSRVVECAAGIGSASFVAQVSAKYRPRLEDVDKEFRRRLGAVASVRTLNGATRVTRYTSAELHKHSYEHAASRQPGHTMPNAIIVPISKTAAWWQMTPLERQAYFYPHTDGSGQRVKGHAVAAEEGVPSVFRRLYHNPDGYQRENEYDFVAYFECRDEDLPVYDRISSALRDEQQNPEWQFVIEGPEWRGRRVLRW